MWLSRQPVIGLQQSAESFDAPNLSVAIDFVLRLDDSAQGLMNPLMVIIPLVLLKHIFKLLD
jgi:hypothetical protein